MTFVRITQPIIRLSKTEWLGQDIYLTDIGYDGFSNSSTPDV